MNGGRLTVLSLGFAPLVAAISLLFAIPMASAGVEVGDKAPDFELQSTTGGKIRLSDFAGKENVIIEFYLLDFAPA